METVNVQKIHLRSRLIAQRKQYDLLQRRLSDEKIYYSFISSDCYTRADTVLCYVSYGFEVDTQRIIDTALKDNKIVAVPKCSDLNGNMVFKIIHSFSDLKSGAYGIPEPDDSAPVLTGFGSAVCIVPGLAFSRSGHRIGYGKGYYDRFLENFAGISVGICYNDFMCDNLPHDLHDITVNMLITEYSAVKL